MTDSVKLRQNVIKTCRNLASGGYVFGTWGNISVRLDDANLLMTPSRVLYDAMKPVDLVVLAPDGTRVSGTRLATSERELHRGIMNARLDVQAIIHTHSPYAIAAAAMDGGIPVLSEEMCQLIGGEIPITARFVPSENHLELGEVVTEAIRDKNAVLIRNHGIVCCGRTLEEAAVCCRIAEKSAQIYLALLSSGCRINTVREPNVSMGRQYYLVGYGKT